MLMKVGLRWCIWFIIFFTIVICYCYNTCIYSHIALQTKSAQCKWPSQLLQSKPFKMMLLAFSIAYSILVKYRLINFHIVRIKISKIQKKQDTVKIYSILWWNQTLIIWNSCWFRHLDMVPALPISSEPSISRLFPLIRIVVSFMYRLKALTHYKDFHKDFSKKNRWENCCPYVKLLKKSLQLWKKVVVCMDDNDFFCSFSCSVRGP